jgi:hypothetical protein
MVFETMMHNGQWPFPAGADILWIFVNPDTVAEVKFNAELIVMCYCSALFRSGPGYEVTAESGR